MQEIKFNHRQSAHCENGVAVNIFQHNGIDIDEPLVFGIGSGLFYIYIPFLKVNQAPSVSYRPMPGQIFSRTAKRLNIDFKREYFSDVDKSFDALDKNLDKGIVCGLQVGVYQLPYFPEEYRFHFNAHNIVVYGKEGNDYLISDPVMETTTRLTKEEMTKVRFTKGIFSPRGQMYYPVKFPKNLDLETAIYSGIKKDIRDMLTPLPYVGLNGIKSVAKRIPQWAKKSGIKKTNYYLAQIIRMQEEIGTGGGGFRFIYSAFLQEAAEIVNRPDFNEFSERMTEIGDQWRNFALEASRIIKKRSKNNGGYQNISDLLMNIYKKELLFFSDLKKATKK